MIKSIILLTLCSLFLFSAVQCQVDTSPYTSLASQIEAIEADIIDAQSRRNYERALDLSFELDALKLQLQEPQMQYLKEYTEFDYLVDESEFLLQQVAREFPDSIASSRENLDSLKQSKLASESLYESASYSSAFSQLRTLRPQLLDFPIGLVELSITQLEELKSNSQLTSQISRTTLAMFDNSGSLLDQARDEYSEAKASILNNDPDTAKTHYSNARGIVKESFDLISRASEKTSQLDEIIKLLLIFVPLLLVAGLIVYFKVQFRKPTIASKLSKDSVPPNKETLLERKLVVHNNENQALRFTVTDSPPRAVKAQDFSVQPTEKTSNHITWVFEIEPGKKMDLSYKLKFPSLDAGWKLHIPAAGLHYNLGREQVRHHTKPVDIRVK
jgi:hypothetical protein